MSRILIMSTISETIELGNVSLACGEVASYEGVAFAKVAKESVAANERRLELVEELGSGAFASAFLTSCGQVLKVQAYNHNFPYAASDEAENCACLYDAKAVDGEKWSLLLLPYMGKDLTKFEFCEDECVLILQDLLEQAEELAKNGIVHSDIKPANVCCTNDTKSWNYRLIDFGHSGKFGENVKGFTEKFSMLKRYRGEEEETGKVSVWDTKLASSHDIYGIALTVGWCLVGEKEESKDQLLARIAAHESELAELLISMIRRPGLPAVYYLVKVNKM